MEITVNNLTQVLEPVEAVHIRRQFGARAVVSFLAVVALLGAALVIAHDAGTTSVDQAPVVQVSDGGAVDLGMPATLNQFNPANIACVIIQALISAFARTPFGSLAVAILQAILATLGCPSG